MALNCLSTQHAVHKFGQPTRNLFEDKSENNYPLAQTPADEPIIPDPNTLEPGSICDSSDSSDLLRSPTISECAVHLELLETFYVLRQCILKSETIDGTFGIKAIHEEKTGRNGDKKLFKDDTLWERRQMKWIKYLEFAVVRFMKWQWEGRKVFGESATDILDESLPPVDVIMVWHSFLLNPKLFRNHCQQHPIYRTRFPWQAIHKAINNRDWTFSLSSEASGKFESVTGLADNLFEQLSTWKTLHETSAEELSVNLAELNLQHPPTTPTWISNLTATDQVYRHFMAFQRLDNELAVQLRDAVVRQTSFVDKMNARLWIRSPALSGTLQRAIARYDKFVRLFKLYPTTMLVPTLDIDLVWHTHQCAAFRYFVATKERAGKFVNHDDSIVSDKLEDGFANTRALFRIRFGQEYQSCGCWDCEALLSALENPTEAANGEPDMERISKEVQSDVTYYRAVEIARRKKKPIPIRG